MLTTECDGDVQRNARAVPETRAVRKVMRKFAAVADVKMRTIGQLRHGSIEKHHLTLRGPSSQHVDKSTVIQCVEVSTHPREIRI